MPDAVRYGDTDVLRRRADQLREQAADIRVLADQLVAQTEAIGWSGRAAASMRERVTERASHLREAAGHHEGAADALDRHTVEVDHVTEAIADVERRAGAMVVDARSRLADVQRTNEAADSPDVRVEPDPDDVTLAAFDAPPSGHRDWLAVTLPGL